MKAFVTNGVVPATLLTLATAVASSPVEYPVKTDPAAINKWSDWYGVHEVDGYEYRYSVITSPKGYYFESALLRRVLVNAVFRIQLIDHC